jgi:Omp85 superfamily domain
MSTLKETRLFARVSMDVTGGTHRAHRLRMTLARKISTRPWCPAIVLIVIVLGAAQARAQPPGGDADTRASALARMKADKAKALHVYEPNKAERWLARAETMLLTGGLRFHPFFESAYSGGGFTLGAGYRRFVSPYNTVDLRGSVTLSGYKRVEAEFLAPRLFNRRGVLSLIGGWREATQVGFYGIGTQSSSEDRANYSFMQPYVSGRIEVWPTRRLFVLGGGLEYSQWDQGPGSGTVPSVEEIYTPATLPGLGARPTYLHAEGSAALDWRTSAGYSRRGGAYGVTVHEFADRNSSLGFRRVDYDAIQHIPLLRDAWVLSLHGRVETTYTGDDEEIPFFMLPALGGGSTLRGFASWRFRDKHSLLMQAEWRVLANRFLDMAVFYDTGKVVSRRAEISFEGLKSDFGLGFRLHGPAATPLRIELAKSNEGIALVFSAKAAF